MGVFEALSSAWRLAAVSVVSARGTATMMVKDATATRRCGEREVSAAGLRCRGTHPRDAGSGLCFAQIGNWSAPRWGASWCCDQGGLGGCGGDDGDGGEEEEGTSEAGQRTAAIATAIASNDNDGQREKQLGRMLETHQSMGVDVSKR